MTRGTYVWDPITGKVVEKSKRTPEPPAKRAAAAALKRCRKAIRGRFYWNGRDWVPYADRNRAGRGHGLQLVRDVDPYRSVITGETIGGRRQHRDHLRAHGCVEIGNDMPQRRESGIDREGIRQDLKRALETGMTPEVSRTVDAANRAAPRDRVWD